MKNIFRTRRRNPPQHNEEQQTATPFFNKTNDSSNGPFFSKSNGVVQTKLSVGQPDDVYEQEADAVADAVVQNQQKGTAPAIQQKGISSIQRTLTSAGTGAGTAEERMKEDQLVQEKQEPGIQKMDKPLEEDEAVKPPALQKKDMPKEEEDPLAKGAVQKKDMPKEEEDPLAKGAVQKKDMPKEEEDPLAKGAVQKKDMPKEEEDPLAKGAVQKKDMPKEEEEKPGAAPAVMTKSDGTQTASPQLSQGIESSKGKGSALPDTTRADMEASFGHDFSGVNIHTGQEATDLNKGLNAQAFTHGQDVYFNAGKYSPETTEGKRLLAHELTHVVQQKPGDTTAANKPSDVQMRAATWLERRAWLSFFDHYIPRMFLGNYMDDSGAPILLTEQQMKDCNPIVDIRRCPAIMAEVSRLLATGGGTGTVNQASGWGGAMTNGSLGNFTIYYSGTVTVTSSGEWSFSGTMTFYDFWDFDPKDFGNSGRSTAGEVKTRVGAYLIPGAPFNIYSVSVPIGQTNLLSSANWGAGYVSSAVGDQAGRSGSDIATGGDLGDVSAGPVGGDVGSEVGAQSAEDLN